MPFSWYSSHKNGVAVFGLIAQTDVLLIESSTTSLEELSQFQNWIATFLVLSIVGPVDKVIVPEQILANTTHQRRRKQKKGGLNHPLEVQGHDGKETFLSHGWNASFSDFG